MLARLGHSVEVFAASPRRSVVEASGSLRTHWIKTESPTDFAVKAGHLFAIRHREHRFDVLEGPEYRADARVAVRLVPDIPLLVKMHTPFRTIVKLNDPIKVRPFLTYQAKQFLLCLNSLSKGNRPSPWTWDYQEESIEWDRIERQHVGEADIVAPPCRSLHEFARDRWEVPEDKLRLSPYPYTPSSEMLNIDSKTSSGKRVTFVGRLERRKGVETLTKAIPSVLKQVPDAVFEFVGAPTFRIASKETYDAWIRRKLKGLSSCVEFTGRLPLTEISRVYERASICVFPSLWENFPNVCLEAMSAGRAVIGSSAGGMSDMLNGGELGLLPRPNSATELATCIVSLLKNEEQRAYFGAAARERVLTEYCESRISEMMLHQYSEAISIRGGRKRKIIGDLI